jgi:hypothetical protein
LHDNLSLPLLLSFLLLLLLPPLLPLLTLLLLPCCRVRQCAQAGSLIPDYWLQVRVKYICCGKQKKTVPSCLVAVCTTGTQIPDYWLQLKNLCCTQQTDFCHGWRPE